MNHFRYVTQGVCSQVIEFDIDDAGLLHNVVIVGGCAGNTKGLCALVEGRSAREVAKRLSSIDCKGRGTSCPDQLSKAIGQALNQPTP